MRRKTRRGFLTAVLLGLAGRIRPDELERIDGVTRLRVGSRRSHLTVSLDGEVLRVPPPLDYRIRRSALRVIAP
jgi:diacylglycerol kinase family enzyme